MTRILNFITGSNGGRRLASRPNRSAAFNISLYATAGDRSFTLKVGNVVRSGESEAGPYAARAIAGKRALIAKT
jgi:hypothetical protein